MSDSELRLGSEERLKIWKQVIDATERHWSALAARPVVPAGLCDTFQRDLAAFDFQKPVDSESLLRWTSDVLANGLLQTSHPCYHGVFNPAPSTLGVAADFLVAAFNPQLASSSSAKACLEIEDHLIRFFAGQFGLPAETTEGGFTAGGTEANHTALLCALNHRWPRYKTHGLEAKQPMIYVSRETHHSILRAAMVSGLGSQSVREIPVTGTLEIDTAALEAAIKADQRASKTPLFLCATLGSTSSGTFDPLEKLLVIARHYGLWLHADAAWGGAAILLPEYASYFSGTSQVDSLTLDAHKWLSIPMGAGLFLTRHAGIREAAFRTEESPYMPTSTYHAPGTEPYKQSLQWSRRFIGLKLFLTLARHGIGGYQKVLRHQIEMGEVLRARLKAEDWTLFNSTPFPVVCFWDAALTDQKVNDFAAWIAERRQTWVTPTQLQHTGQRVLRAGIPSFETNRESLEVLLEELRLGRQAFLAKG